MLKLADTSLILINPSPRNVDTVSTVLKMVYGPSAQLMLADFIAYHVLDMLSHETQLFDPTKIYQNASLWTVTK